MIPQQDKVKKLAIGIFVLAVTGSIISLWLPWLFLFKNRSLFDLFDVAKDFQDLKELEDLKKVTPFAFAFYFFPFLAGAGLLLLSAGKKIYGFTLTIIPVLCIGVTGIFFYMTVGLQKGVTTSLLSLILATLGLAVFFALDRS